MTVRRRRIVQGRQNDRWGHVQAAGIAKHPPPYDGPNAGERGRLDTPARSQGPAGPAIGALGAF